ncbi:hypothetical protein BB561_004158 [Smittium simulii]|uniref:Glucose-6-phosphate isomerase n=1 Tax=Smittium simulii TaxID=133385 RepID=A0A2T9YHQ1_9FUNG|nr:hypothetical protein BB561_004158 [Smittium simulii]
MEDYTELSSYTKLAEHYKKTAKKIDLCKEFNENSDRQATFCRKNTFENNSGNTAKIIFDFSKNLIDKETFSLLLEFAEEVKLKEYIECFFSGAVKKSIKCTKSQKKKKYQDDLNYETDLNISTICENMKKFSEDICSQNRLSVYGSIYSSIVIIGIKSSNVNYGIVSNAFSNVGATPILYFAGNTKGSRIEDILKKIDFKTTLFIISCKNFTDKDTILSAEAAKNFIKDSCSNVIDSSDITSYNIISFDSYMKTNFVAISNNRKLVKDFGISDSNIFDFCDWIDDRVCSFWTEMILPMSIRIGFNNYYMFLQGCYSMNMHFRYTPIKDNMPVIMALLDFWYNDFWGAKTFPILPYDHRLATFATNFQRIDTESEKKSSIGVELYLDHQLGPPIWNEGGDNNRSMFYQLINQGKKVIPCDLIAVVKKQKSDSNILHDKLALSNFFALSEALMEGSKDYETFTPVILRDLNKVDSQADTTIVNKAYAGNKPSSSIMIASDITPTSNAQDIKLVKYLAKNILTELNTDGKVNSHNESTNELINFYKDNSK